MSRYPSVAGGWPGPRKGCGSSIRAGSRSCRVSPLGCTEPALQAASCCHRLEGAPRARSAGSGGRVKRQQLGAVCQKCREVKVSQGKERGRSRSSSHREKGKEKPQSCKCPGSLREARALLATPSWRMGPEKAETRNKLVFSLA